MANGIVFLAAVMFGFITGFVRRREDCSNVRDSGRDHEPRAVHLLDGERYPAESVWVETQLGEDTLSLCTVRPYPIVRRTT